MPLSGRHVGHVLGQKLLATVIDQTRQRAHHAAGARQTGGGRTEADLDKLQVDELRPCAVGHSVAVTGAVRGEHVGGEHVAGATGGEHHGSRADHGDGIILL